MTVLKVDKEICVGCIIYLYSSNVLSYMTRTQGDKEREYKLGEQYNGGYSCSVLTNNTFLLECEVIPSPSPSKTIKNWPHILQALLLYWQFLYYGHQAEQSTILEYNEVILTF